MPKSIPKNSPFRNSEYIFLMTKELKLDPGAGYHAIEILQK